MIPTCGGEYLRRGLSLSVTNVNFYSWDGRRLGRLIQGRQAAGITNRKLLWHPCVMGQMSDV